MFFSQPNQLPDELLCKILNELDLKTAISLLQTTKKTRAIAQDDNFWRKYGAKDLEDFMRKAKALPKYFQHRLIKDNLTFQACMNVYQSIQVSAHQNNAPGPFEIIRRLMPKYQTALSITLDYESYNYKQKTNIIMGLLWELMSPEQISKLDDLWIVQLLSTDNGLKALRNKLITPEEAAQIKLHKLSSVLEERVAKFEADRNAAVNTDVRPVKRLKS